VIKKWWLRFKRFILPYPLGFIGKYSMKLILSTCKIEVSGLEHLQTLPNKTGILMLWHNRIAIMCEFFDRYLSEMQYAAFLSKSRDGEPIARVIQRYRGGRSIRVAHATKHQALKEAVTYLNHHEGLLLITPDGPKGPRYKIKPGIVFAAQETRSPILGFSWESDNYWEFNTWDQFRLPKPFTTIKIAISPPIHLDPSLDTDASLTHLEHALHNHFN
jgi:lysophospholipid acyltransferase (LPLAT)-like uncharacterized protein